MSRPVTHHPFHMVASSPPERDEYEETNDCTVRAYSTASGISYASAHYELAQFGRKHRAGCDFLRFAARTGWMEFPKPSMTVSSYIKRVACKGDWIIYVKDHVFAVKNSVIYDMDPASVINQHVIKAWRLK